MRVEDEFTDVLQNIEYGIVITYRAHPELSDYNVISVLESLTDAYKAEQIGRTARHVPLTDVEGLLLKSVRRMCEWRLGRTTLGPGGGNDEGILPEPITVDQLILCLKRILKSVKKWNASGGRQGYLSFVAQYVR